MTPKNAHVLTAQTLGIPAVSTKVDKKLTEAALQGVQDAIDAENRREAARIAKEIERRSKEA